VPIIPIQNQLDSSRKTLIGDNINRRKTADENRTRTTSGEMKPQTITERRKTSKDSSEEENNIYDSNICCECWEDYSKKTSKCDWFQCGKCGRLWHESCTMYGLFCNSCGSDVKRKIN
jgi:hypothetical protein